MTKKMTVAKKAAQAIQVATAKIICQNMVQRHGDGYRIADIVVKLREITGNYLLNQKTFLAAIQGWFDSKIARFNNRFLTPIPKKASELNKLAAS